MSNGNQGVRTFGGYYPITDPDEKEEIKGQIEVIDLSEVPESDRKRIGRKGERLYDAMIQLEKGSKDFDKQWDIIMTTLRNSDATTEWIEREEKLLTSYFLSRYGTDGSGITQEEIWKAPYAPGVRWDQSLKKEETVATAASDLQQSIAAFGPKKFLLEMTPDEIETVFSELKYDYQFADIVEGQKIPKEKGLWSPMTWQARPDPKGEPDYLSGGELRADLGTAAGAGLAGWLLAGAAGPWGWAAGGVSLLASYLAGLGMPADTPENVAVEGVGGLETSKTDILYPGFTEGEGFDIAEGLYHDLPAVREANLIGQFTDFHAEQYALQKIVSELDVSFFAPQYMSLEHEDIMEDTAGVTHAEKVVNYYLAQGFDTPDELRRLLGSIKKYKTQFKERDIDEQLEWGLNRGLLPGSIENEKYDDEIEALTGVANRLVAQRGRE